YVVNESDSTLSTFRINASNGALTSVGTPVASGGLSSPQSVTVDPTGRFAYVGGTGKAVAAFSISSFTGVLTSLGSANAGERPATISVAPSGRFAYSANANDDTVATLSINANTGELTRVGTSAPTGDAPQAVSVDASGKFVYVVNKGSNTVSTFSINASTGALTPVGAPVATGTGPFSIATTYSLQ
ncbi:MAG: lactonase family protein, partial [Rhodoferax sp.]